MAIDVTIEKGARRVFACAADWPGLARSARDSSGALAALVAYARRYAQVAGRAFPELSDVAGLRVVERAKGDATPDFGAPSIEMKAHRRPLEPADLRRLVRLLKACWAAFDAAAASASGAVLTTGPRGGGRSVEKMRAHVLEADGTYLKQLGGKPPQPPLMETTRNAMIRMLASRARGEIPELSPRRTSPLWSPRFTIHRSAWHALDHAWEIEDRLPDER